MPVYYRGEAVHICGGGKGQLKIKLTRPDGPEFRWVPESEVQQRNDPVWAAAWQAAWDREVQNRQGTDDEGGDAGDDW